MGVSALSLHRVYRLSDITFKSKTFSSKWHRTTSLLVQEKSYAKILWSKALGAGIRAVSVEDPGGPWTPLFTQAECIFTHKGLTKLM